MPTTTIDTFFACSLLVILVVSSMAGLPKILYPFLDGLAHKNDVERFRQLAQYILLSTGTPSDWGTQRGIPPTTFGLASSNSQPYTLDIDKVTRLNSENDFAITYAQLLDALKTNNLALKIRIQTIFSTSINLTSTTNIGSETAYSFRIATQKSGLPVVSNLSCYLTVRNYVTDLISSTNSVGEANVTFTIPNNVNGSVLFVVFAKAQVKPSMQSFGIYSFGHNASSPMANGFFMRLNPFGYVLDASYNRPTQQVLGAYAFSYGCWANLTLLSNATQNVEYVVPHFLDESPTILVITGLNSSESFAEYVTYPQVPLEIGVNFDSSTSSSLNVSVFTYVVAINRALYELHLRCREVG